jgi:phospholipase C
MAGVDRSNPKHCQDLNGHRYYQRPTVARQVSLDPEHSMPDTALQMAFGRMDGFLKDYQFLHPDATPEQLQAIMDYYPLGFLPADHTLARHFQIFDHWHASVPGPTWPNRFFSLMGTSYGLVNMPPGTPKLHDIKLWFEEDQPTLFDRLNEAGISWKVYFHDIPFSLLLKRQRHLHNAAHYFDIERLWQDMRGPAAAFPQFVYIEPRYQGIDESDDHPPHDIMKAQKFKADLYNALMANEELRNSTLLIFTYDEHGGFFDDVYPPEAAPPDNRNHEYAFNQLGLRIPTTLISPWVERGFDSGVYDHTSVLRYLQQKWNLGDLGTRTAHATNFAHLIGNRSEPRTDFPLRIELTADQLTPPDADADRATADTINHLNLSMTALGGYLKSELAHKYVGFARLVMAIASLWRWCKRRARRACGLFSEHDEALENYREVVQLLPEYLEYARQQVNRQASATTVRQRFTRGKRK